MPGLVKPGVLNVMFGGSLSRVFEERPAGRPNRLVGDEPDFHR